MRPLREPLIYVSYVTDDCFRRSSETTSRGRQNEAKRVRMLPGETLIPLTLFTALLLVLSLHILAASGQFPREHRAPALASGVGGIILYGTIAGDDHEPGGRPAGGLAADPLVCGRHRRRLRHSRGAARAAAVSRPLRRRPRVAIELCRSGRVAGVAAGPVERRRDDLAAARLESVLDALHLELEALADMAAVPLPGGQQLARLFRRFRLDAPFLRAGHEHRGVKRLRRRGRPVLECGGRPLFECGGGH